jgi:hypothetical protein
MSAGKMTSPILERPKLRMDTETSATPKLTPEWILQDSNSEKRRLLSKILYSPPFSWKKEELLQYLMLPSNLRPPNVPVCKEITHYRRTGKLALYDVLCHFKSSMQPAKKEASFWVPYTLVLAHASCCAALMRTNFDISALLHVYDPEEPAEAYESHSDDEGMYHKGLKLGRIKLLGPKKKRLLGREVT